MSDDEVWLASAASETRDDVAEVLGVRVRLRDPAAEVLLAALCGVHAPLWTLPEKTSGRGAGLVPR